MAEYSWLLYTAHTVLYLQGLYTSHSEQKFKDFSRTFLSTNLPATCRQARQWELENMCKPDIHSALVAQWTCTKATKGPWVQVSKHFKNFILWLLVMNICFHWLSFRLKLININIFQSCSTKNQGLSRTKNQFQVISRPWNKTPEILGFSRFVQALCICCRSNQTLGQFVPT